MAPPSQELEPPANPARFNLADLDRTYVSSLERCVYGATVDVVERIAGVLGTEPFELLRPVEGAAAKAAPARRGRGRPIG